MRLLNSPRRVSQPARTHTCVPSECATRFTSVIPIDSEKATNTEPFAAIWFSGATHERGESLRNIFVREEGESDDGEDEEEEPEKKTGKRTRTGKKRRATRGRSPLP